MEKKWKEIATATVASFVRLQYVHLLCGFAKKSP